MRCAGEDRLPTPQRRLVLLGASNLARGIGSAVAVAGASWNEPLDLLAALGHGRSYGMPNWVLGRKLPGIIECQLWNDLDARLPLPTAAIVTDAGNDILYGASPEKISAWIKICCERLLRHHARVSITGIPLASLALMRAWEFRFFRSILYPVSRVTFADARAMASELDGRLRELAREVNANFIEPQSTWYGIDRIHIRRVVQDDVWRQFISPMCDDSARDLARSTWGLFFYLRSLTPYQRWFFGMPNGQSQPSGRLANGTRVSLY